MVNPKKISDEGRALTCDEYDENLDILQDRSNHTGVQSCDTLSDLDTCLAVNPVITALDSTISNNTSRITQLEDDLGATGTIANDLSVLEATLRSEITQNTNDINTINNTIDPGLISDIAGNTSQINTLSQTVTNNFNNLEPRISALDNATTGRVTMAEADIDNLETRATTIENVTIPAEALARTSADATLQANIDNEVQNRIDEIIRVEGLITDEVNDRTQDVDTVDQKFDIITDSLIQNLDNEIQDRIDGDLLLQTQITSLSNSLSGAIPTGTVLAYAGVTLPTGFLWCQGGSVSRTTYSALFSVVSTRYGSSSASTFNVPDLRNRIPYGSSTSNLNSASTYVFENEKQITTTELPSHTHSVNAGDHTHDVDIDHFHTLNIRSHSHSIGDLPHHSHSLAPFRLVALGGGSEDNTGAEITTIQSDDPGNNINPNTELSASGIPGPAVGDTTIAIHPGVWQGINRTDDHASTKTTTLGGSLSQNSGSAGSGQDFDVRQAGLNLNFIIKT